VGIDEDGWPVPIKVPDPRAFALHKAWLSTLTTREPVKKQRDLAQANEHCLSTPGCPWENGRIERLFGTLKNKLDQLPFLISHRWSGQCCNFYSGTTRSVCTST
jgi:transposase InsO family protein